MIAVSKFGSRNIGLENCNLNTLLYTLHVRGLCPFLSTIMLLFIIKKNCNLNPCMEVRRFFFFFETMEVRRW
jgi:hypothetical protein